MSRLPPGSRNLSPPGDGALRCRLRGLPHLPRRGCRGIRDSRPRDSRVMRRHPGVLGLPRQPRDPALGRQALEDASAQPAADLRRLPRRPQHHPEVRHSHRPSDPGLRVERPRQGVQGRHLRRRHVQRLPLDGRVGTPNPFARPPGLLDQSLQHSRDMLQVPQGRHERLHGRHPWTAGRTWGDRCSHLHHLPRGARHSVAGRSTLTRLALARGAGHLFSLPRVGRPQREVRGQERSPRVLHRFVPRAQERGRRSARRQLRLVPRRAPHPAEP